MDGLLVDSEPLWFEVLGAFVRERSRGVWTPEHARRCTGKGVASTLAFISDTFGFPVDVPGDAAAIFDSVIERVSDVTLKPGAREIVAFARASFRTALASSSPMRLINAALAHFELASFFDVVVSGDSVARTKPAPDIFLRAAEALGVPPSACVVLEDSIAGATAGRAAGMIVIAVPEGPPEGRGFEAVADAVLPDLWAASAYIKAYTCR